MARHMVASAPQSLSMLSLGSYRCARVVAKTGCCGLFRGPDNRQNVGWERMELSERLVRERRARLAAERLLEQKSRELFAANEKLAIHARSLSDQIVEQRQVVKSALSQAETLKDQNLSFIHISEPTRPY